MTFPIPNSSSQPKRLRGNRSRAFELSIEVIRTAQGKLNPDDCVVGTAEWQDAQVGVMRDSMRITDLLRRSQRLTARRFTDVDGLDI